MGQAQIEVDRSQLSERLSALHETHRMARERLLSVPPLTQPLQKGRFFHIGRFKDKPGPLKEQLSNSLRPSR